MKGLSLLDSGVRISLPSSILNMIHDTNAQWKPGGQPINFEGEPHKGYALFKQSDLNIHGHPSGLVFRSVKSFVDHVHAIMIGRVGPCCCVVCLAEGSM
jgi:hypothetical protein